MKRKSYKTGEHVEWDTPQGITEGDIEEEVTSRTHIKKHTVAASQKDPQYKVRSSKSGKIAIHRPEELRKKKKAH
ncbi:MAG: DUF2945 domain-containing protein [Chitinispirillaceae bacterium]|nr:DUF2945 domain-containing protein [Chitinispirillaceae bacterium]